MTLSIILWNVLPALGSLKPILKNSYRPNDVMMAVLAMSLACMGDLVVALAQIHLAENVTTKHLCHKIHHVRQWVGIWDGDKVKKALVTAGPPTPVWLLDHVEE